jgi:hypothetical protein
MMPQPKTTRPTLVGEHEMDILALIGAGQTMDEILEAGPWTLNDITTVLSHYELRVDDEGRVVGVAKTFSQLVTSGMESPSALVRQQAERAYAHLLRLNRLMTMHDVRGISDDLRREKRLALQEWLEWLGNAAGAARGELARLRASSPRSDRAKRAAAS